MIMRYSGAMFSINVILADTYNCGFSVNLMILLRCRILDKHAFPLLLNLLRFLVDGQFLFCKESQDLFKNMLKSFGGQNNTLLCGFLAWMSKWCLSDSLLVYRLGHSVQAYFRTSIWTDLWWALNELGILNPLPQIEQRWTANTEIHDIYSIDKEVEKNWSVLHFSSVCT